eukprot:scaffold110467_cov63-Phaeocystis_antarctica.AAC.2
MVAGTPAGNAAGDEVYTCVRVEGRRLRREICFPLPAFTISKSDKINKIDRAHVRILLPLYYIYSLKNRMYELREPYPAGLQRLALAKLHAAGVVGVLSARGDAPVRAGLRRGRLARQGRLHLRRHLRWRRSLLRRHLHGDFRRGRGLPAGGVADFRDPLPVLAPVAGLARLPRVLALGVLHAPLPRHHGAALDGPADGWHHGLGRVAVVVVDDRVDAAVEHGHHAQVGRGQPAEARAPHPAAWPQQLVEDLVIRGLGVGAIGHRFGPRAHQRPRALRVVEVDDTAACARRVLPVALVAPVVEDGHVARPVRPAARREELGVPVELEVAVQPHHGLARRLHLTEDEARLDRDELEAEGLGALGRVGPEGVGRLSGLAADVVPAAALEQAFGLELLARVDAALLERQLARVVLVVREGFLLALGRRRELRALGPALARRRDLAGRRVEEELGVDARARALAALVHREVRAAKPVLVRALARFLAVHALVRHVLSAALGRNPGAVRQPRRLLALRRLGILHELLARDRRVEALAEVGVALPLQRRCPLRLSQIQRLEFRDPNRASPGCQQSVKPGIARRLARRQFPTRQF